MLYSVEAKIEANELELLVWNRFPIFSDNLETVLEVTES